MKNYATKVFFTWFSLFSSKNKKKNFHLESSYTEQKNSTTYNLD